MVVSVGNFTSQLCSIVLSREPQGVLYYQLDTETFLLKSFIIERLVHVFLWAQRDPINQTLYYIHCKKPLHRFVEDEEQKCKHDTKVLPTLPGLQFHDDLPHETVMNISLSLPHLISIFNTCGVYKDDTVPLCIHDCLLDLIVLSNSQEIICICHHYLYQPIQPAVSLKDDDEISVHFAYSVTVLHQSCIIQCVIPEIPWNQAKAIRPTFLLYGDHYILVYIPGICIHLLHIGVLHEPVCHITLNADFIGLESHEISLVP